MAFAFIIYLALDLVYSLVNIPYGSLNASLTRDPESIDKLTSTRMMLANSANLLVYTLFPMFVQMAAPKDRSLKDTGFLAASESRQLPAVRQRTTPGSACTPSI